MGKQKAYEVTKDESAKNVKERGLRGCGCCRMQVVILTLVIFVVCGNFAMPTLFYYLRPTVVRNTDVCSEPVVYTGATCRAELQTYQECFSGSAGSNGDIFIRSDIDPETVEVNAELLLDHGLPIVNPSAECLAAIRPFLCLHLFGVCDSSNQLRQVSSSECVDLRDNICIREWSAAIGFLGAGTLPVCEELAVSQTEACANGSSSGFSVISDDLSSENTTITRECNTDYYLNNESLCSPLCGYGDNDYTIEKDGIITIIACCIAVISALVVFILSFTVQRDFILTFPSYFLLYLCLTTFVEAVTVLIGFFDKEALFCNSIDLLDSISNPTPFCTISGIVYYYALMQSTVWVFFHVVALFWGIAFPFHYRQFKANDYIKYIHIATVAVALLVPLVSALVPLKDGYIPPRFPPLVCIAENADYTFYILVLPISILMATLTSLLIIIFWIILKEFVIKKISRGKKVSRVGKAEVKIMFVFCYYILLGGLALGIFGFYVGANDMLIADFQNLFLCESLGANSGKDCDSLKSSSGVFSYLGLVGIVMQGLISFVVLIFIIDFKVCKCKKKKTGANNLATTNKTAVQL